METAARVLVEANHIYARATASPSPTANCKPAPAPSSRPPVYKIIGLCLAIGSGLFIGTSFVLKKKGLLKANLRYNEEAGEGYGYLKNTWWWTGMTLMIFGEILNFVAYAFTEAILVTPLGALSVVVTTIGSAIFLKERLSFVGKVACFLCILGAIIIVVNAPTVSSAADIQQMQHFVLAPGFLSYAGVIVLGSAFLAFWAGPRYGKRSMMVYISICSWVGGLSVVATQGLGAAIVSQASGKPQFNHWFLYVLLVFVVGTLVTEIIFLNKALNIFNAALVTPTYYVYFTSTTIITSAILFRGFKGSPASIATVVMGFLTICAGVVLLQLSKSAKDVPDTAIFAGDLDQMRTVAEQEQPESEPKADAIRGAAALIRRISLSRQKMEAEEARRYHQDRVESMEPIGEDEQFVWDGIRRRRTQSGTTASFQGGTLKRRKTLHPPLGLTHFPELEEARSPEDSHQPPRTPRTREGPDEESGDDGHNGSGILGSIRSRAKSVWLPGSRRTIGEGPPETQSPTHPVALTQMNAPGYHKESHLADNPYHGSGTGDEPAEHVYGLPGSLRIPPHEQDTAYRGHAGVGGPPVQWVEEVEGGGGSGGGGGGAHRPLTPKSPMRPRPKSPAKRQFSFHNVFNRRQTPQPYDGAGGDEPQPTIRPVESRKGMGSRQSSRPSHTRAESRGATEEERLGLVKGDGTGIPPPPEYLSDEDNWQLEGKAHPSRGSDLIERYQGLTGSEEKELNAHPSSYQQRDRQAQVVTTKPVESSTNAPPVVPRMDEEDQARPPGPPRGPSKDARSETRPRGGSGGDGRGPSGGVAGASFI